MVPSPFTFTYTWISLPSNIFTNSSPGVEFSLIMYLYIPALTASSVNPIFPLSSVLSVYSVPYLVLIIVKFAPDK